MIIAVYVAAILVTACLAEMARRGHLGRRMVEDMQGNEAPRSPIRILRTEEELRVALQRLSEAERLKARQAETRADRYAAAADSMTIRDDLSPETRSVSATA